MRENDMHFPIWDAGFLRTFSRSRSSGAGAVIEASIEAGLVRINDCDVLQMRFGLMRAPAPCTKRKERGTRRPGLLKVF